MAPRTRKRKVGLRRIDAALAAMRPLGFSDGAVRKSIKELLRVYGDDGWYFMEEAAYKLLIETILEGQEQAQPEILLKEGNGEKEGANANGINEKPKSTEDVYNKDICMDQSCVKDLQGEIFINEVGNLDKKVNEEEKCFEVDSRVSSKDEIEQVRFTSQRDFAPIYSAMVAEPFPSKLRHKPCYGWISDDEEDDDFLLLPPAKAFQNLLSC